MARNAVKEYRTSIIIAVEESNAADTFLSVANMKLKHGGFYRKALDFFAQHQMGDAGPNSPILDKLKKVHYFLFLFAVNYFNYSLCYRISIMNLRTGENGTN